MTAATMMKMAARINRLLPAIVFVHILQVLAPAEGLQLTEILVPDVADVQETVTLSCSYDMGTHKLNSVKWYKDEREFFRYSPLMPQNLMLFDVDGVTVLQNSTAQVCNHYMCSIQLHKLNTRSSGSYRCEISGDAPEFKLAHGVGNMTVAFYPQYDPIINGLQHNGVQHNYALGDFVVANCSSDMSSPPARLYWFINDRNVPSEYLQPQHETTVENDGFLLRSRTLEIRFYIDEKRLGRLKGKLVLKCLARIDAIPQATRESTQIIYIPTTDELRNQKLINWRSDASTVHRQWVIRGRVLLTALYGIAALLVVVQL